MDTPQLLTTTQVARILGLTPQAIGYRARKGTMPATRNEQGDWRFELSTVAQHMNIKTTR